jgi:hypothetical protein
MAKAPLLNTRIKRVAGGAIAVLALLSLNVLPAAATPEERPIEIVVQSIPDPCAGIVDIPATWSVDPDFTYTSAQQKSTNPFTVEEGTSVNLSLGITWTDGTTCVEGADTPVAPAGDVQATWTMDTLTFSTTMCEVGSCLAGTTSISADVDVPLGADARSYTGNLSLTWVP